MQTKKRLLIRSIAASLLVTFACGDLRAAQFDAPSLTPQQIILQDPSRFQAPLEFATLSEIHPGNQEAFIIHIQDAHSNFSGQENLANALAELMKQYDVRLVLSEGGWGDCSLTPMKKIASSDVWQKVARRFLISGELQGEEYLNLISDRPMKIVGIEDSALYEKGLESYRVLSEKREAVLEYLSKTERAVEKVKSKLYSKEILDYEKSKDGAKFEGGFDALMNIARSHGADLSEFLEVSQLAALRDKEKLVNYDAANLEQAVLAEELSRRGEKINLDSFLKDAGRMKGQKIVQLTYYRNMMDAASKKGIDTAQYNNLKTYFEVLQDFSKVDMDGLLAELDRAEDKVYAAALEADDAKMTRSIDRFVRLVREAHRIQMTSDQFQLFRHNEPDFSTEAMQAFLNRKLAELGYYEDLIPYEGILSEGREALGAFYDSVKERDFAFVKNVDAAMKTEKQKVAVVITGGYHTPHLKKLLAEKGWGYAVLTPIVTAETSQKKYEKLLLSEKTAQKKKTKTVSTDTLPKDKSLGAFDSDLAKLVRRKSDQMRPRLLALDGARMAAMEASLPEGARLSSIKPVGRVEGIQKQLPRKNKETPKKRSGIPTTKENPGDSFKKSDIVSTPPSYHKDGKSAGGARLALQDIYDVREMEVDSFGFFDATRSGWVSGEDLTRLQPHRFKPVVYMNQKTGEVYFEIQTEPSRFSDKNDRARKLRNEPLVFSRSKGFGLDNLIEVIVDNSGAENHVLSRVAQTYSDEELLSLPTRPEDLIITTIFFGNQDIGLRDIESGELRNDNVYHRTGRYLLYDFAEISFPEGIDRELSADERQGYAGRLTPAFSTFDPAYAEQRIQQLNASESIKAHLRQEIAGIRRLSESILSGARLALQDDGTPNSRQKALRALSRSIKTHLENGSRNFPRLTHYRSELKSIILLMDGGFISEAAVKLAVMTRWNLRGSPEKFIRRKNVEMQGILRREAGARLANAAKYDAHFPLQKVSPKGNPYTIAPVDKDSLGATLREMKQIHSFGGFFSSTPLNIWRLEQANYHTLAARDASGRMIGYVVWSSEGSKVILEFLAARPELAYAGIGAELGRAALKSVKEEMALGRIKTMEFSYRETKVLERLYSKIIQDLHRTGFKVEVKADDGPIIYGLKKSLGQYFPQIVPSVTVRVNLPQGARLARGRSLLESPTVSRRNFLLKAGAAVATAALLGPRLFQPQNVVAVLSRDQIRMIEDAAGVFRLEPEFLAGTIIEEMEHEGHKPLSRKIFEDILTFAEPTMDETVGLGQVNVRDHMTRKDILERISESEALIDKLLATDAERDSFKDFLRKYRDPNVPVSHLNTDLNMIELTKLTEIDVVNIFAAAAILRELANDKRRITDQFIPSLKVLSESTEKWRSVNRMRIPDHSEFARPLAMRTKARLNLFREAFGEYYPANFLHVLVAMDYTGVETSLSGTKRAMRKVELYEKFLREGLPSGARLTSVSNGIADAFMYFIAYMPPALRTRIVPLGVRAWTLDRLHQSFRTRQSLELQDLMRNNLSSDADLMRRIVDRDAEAASSFEKKGEFYSQEDVEAMDRIDQDIPTVMKRLRLERGSSTQVGSGRYFPEIWFNSHNEAWTLELREENIWSKLLGFIVPPLRRGSLAGSITFRYNPQGKNLKILDTSVVKEHRSRGLSIALTNWVLAERPKRVLKLMDGQSLAWLYDKLQKKLPEDKKDKIYPSAAALAVKYGRENPEFDAAILKLVLINSQTIEGKKIVEEIFSAVEEEVDRAIETKQDPSSVAKDFIPAAKPLVRIYPEVRYYFKLDPTIDEGVWISATTERYDQLDLFVSEENVPDEFRDWLALPEHQGLSGKTKTLFAYFHGRFGVLPDERLVKKLTEDLERGVISGSEVGVFMKRFAAPSKNGHTDYLEQYQKFISRGIHLTLIQGGIGPELDEYPLVNATKQSGKFTGMQAYWLSEVVRLKIATEEDILARFDGFKKERHAVKRELDLAEKALKKVSYGDKKKSEAAYETHGAVARSIDALIWRMTDDFVLSNRERFKQDPYLALPIIALGIGSDQNPIHSALYRLLRERQLFEGRKNYQADLRKQIQVRQEGHGKLILSQTENEYLTKVITYLSDLHNDAPQAPTSGARLAGISAKDLPWFDEKKSKTAARDLANAIKIYINPNLSEAKNSGDPTKVIKGMIAVIDILNETSTENMNWRLVQQTVFSMNLISHLQSAIGNLELLQTMPMGSDDAAESIDRITVAESRIDQIQKLLENYGTSKEPTHFNEKTNEPTILLRRVDEDRRNFIDKLFQDIGIRRKNDDNGDPTPTLGTLEIWARGFVLRANADQLSSDDWVQDLVFLRYLFDELKSYEPLLKLKDEVKRRGRVAVFVEHYLKKLNSLLGSYQNDQVIRERQELMKAKAKGIGGSLPRNYKIDGFAFDQEAVDARGGSRGFGSWMDETIQQATAQINEYLNKNFSEKVNGFKFTIFGGLSLPVGGHQTEHILLAQLQASQAAQMAHMRHKQEKHGSSYAAVFDEKEFRALTLEGLQLRAELGLSNTMTDGSIEMLSAKEMLDNRSGAQASDERSIKIRRYMEIVELFNSNLPGADGDPKKEEKLERIQSLLDTVNVAIDSSRPPMGRAQSGVLGQKVLEALSILQTSYKEPQMTSSVPFYSEATMRREGSIIAMDVAGFYAEAQSNAALAHFQSARLLLFQKEKGIDDDKNTELGMSVLGYVVAANKKTRELVSEKNRALISFIENKKSGLGLLLRRVRLADGSERIAGLSEGGDETALLLNGVLSDEALIKLTKKARELKIRISVSALSDPRSNPLVLITDVIGAYGELFLTAQEVHQDYKNVLPDVPGGLIIVERVDGDVSLKFMYVDKAGEVKSKIRVAGARLSLDGDIALEVKNLIQNDSDLAALYKERKYETDLGESLDLIRIDGWPVTIHLSLSDPSMYYKLARWANDDPALDVTVGYAKKLIREAKFTKMVQQDIQKRMVSAIPHEVRAWSMLARQIPDLEEIGVDESRLLVWTRFWGTENGVSFYKKWNGFGDQVSPVTLIKKLDLVIRAFRSIEQLHRLGYIHGDIGIGNITVTPTGELMLIDLAEAAKDPGDDPKFYRRDIKEMAMLLEDLFLDEEWGEKNLEAMQATDLKDLVEKMKNDETFTAGKAMIGLQEIRDKFLSLPANDGARLAQGDYSLNFGAKLGSESVSSLSQINSKDREVLAGIVSGKGGARLSAMSLGGGFVAAFIGTPSGVAIYTMPFLSSQPIGTLNLTEELNSLRGASNVTLEGADAEDAFELAQYRRMIASAVREGETLRALPEGVYDESIPVEFRIATSSMTDTQASALQSLGSRLAGGQVTVVIASSASAFTGLKRTEDTRIVYVGTNTAELLVTGASHQAGAMILSQDFTASSLIGPMVLHVGIQRSSGVSEPLKRLWGNIAEDPTVEFTKSVFDRLKQVPVSATVDSYKDLVIRVAKVAWQTALRVAEQRMNAIGSAA